MPYQDMDRNELQQTVAQLEQALYNHRQWYSNLIRTLVCRLPHDTHDTQIDAHKECRFGQWYYANTLKNVLDHPQFIAIGTSHQRMHQLARDILINLDHTNTITPDDYDNFANTLERLSLEIYSFKHEIETILYNHDPLTMAINRSSMLPTLREQQEMGNRQLHSSCIAIIDIDLFKNVNDEYGHLVGDKVLILLVQYITKHLRPYDKVFRYGGEEFLVCLPGTNLSQAFEMVDRIRKEISEMPFNVELQAPLHICVSCGVTILDPNISIEECIDHADKALYLAKSSGRNQTQIWNATQPQ